MQHQKPGDHWIVNVHKSEREPRQQDGARRPPQRTALLVRNEVLRHAREQQKTRGGSGHAERMPRVQTSPGQAPTTGPAENPPQMPVLR